MKRSSKELKRIARANLTGNYRIPMQAMISIFLLTMAAELPFSVLLQSEHPALMQNIISYIAEFLISIISGVLQIGLVQLHLSMARRQNFYHKQIYFCFKNQTDRYIIGVFCMMVLNFVCAIPGIFATYRIRTNQFFETIISTIALCILMVILMASVQLVYNLVYYLLLDHTEMPVRNCFKLSRELMKGHKKRLLYIYVSFLGMGILEVLSVGIGALWIEPYKSQTLANFYLDVIGELPEIPNYETDSPAPSFNEYV